jgi:hypothetical protein
VGRVVVLLNILFLDEVKGVSREVRSELVLSHLSCVFFSLAIMVCPEVDDVVRASAFDVREQVAL